jgi:hypothetical protein
VLGGILESGENAVMTIFTVGYDEREGEDYTALIKALQGFSGWWHCLDSTWLIESNMSAIQIRDHLWPNMHKGDKLLVLYYLPAKSGGQYAWQGFDKNCGEWLNNNL